MSAERVVQAAVYAALTGNAPYVALVTGGVHDDMAPPGTETPYTVLGATTETDESTQDKDGYSLTLTIHDFTGGTSPAGGNEVWGKKLCQQIREARNAVLHRALLTVAGWGLTRISYDFGEIMVEGDEDTPTWHGVSRYSLEALA